ncbi:uncharacterized protein FPRO_10344 [Fusarium proliferatum ET1]|uniref:Uncharacterized protein n=1 Tax=Fusarium proliferatum (strain ET1) TaxID=1227346 RepID=A0A1L7VLI7_FUSPR|nr:uncharacterized protein FPRO_10344 [Fusarium proliferatum ET1]CZR40756.1 uncharacterized protein FPRO_10344 [Fusarium proliferatum ET1]
MTSTELKISYPTKAVHSAVKAAKDTDERAPQRMNGGLIEAANTGQALPDMVQKLRIAAREIVLISDAGSSVHQAVIQPAPSPPIAGD